MARTARQNIGVIGEIEKTLITRKQGILLQINSFDNINRQFDYLKTEIALLKLNYVNDEKTKANAYSLQTKKDKILSYFDDENLQRKIENRIYRLGLLRQRTEFLHLLDRLDNKILYLNYKDMNDFKDYLRKQLPDKVKDIKLIMNSAIFKSITRAKFEKQLTSLPFYGLIEEKLDIDTLYLDFVHQELNNWTIFKVRKDIVFINLPESEAFTCKGMGAISHSTKRVGF